MKEPEPTRDDDDVLNALGSTRGRTGDGMDGATR